MSRTLHSMPISSLPEPGELKDDDQMIAYRSEDGKAYRTDVDSLVSQGTDILNKVYPVGSIYMSVNSADPADFIGGEWEQIQNRFLFAAGDYAAGTEGGTSAVTLSTENLPSHTHSMPSHTHSIPSLSGTAASAGAHRHHGLYNSSAVASGSNAQIASGGSSTTSGYITDNSSGAHTHSVTTNSSTTGSKSGTSGSTGSGSAFDIMPPYLAVYMWQRIA